MIRKLALLSLFPLALVAVGIIRLLARFGILVRFGEIFSARLGHLAANMECYHCERDAGIQPKAIDLWVPQRIEHSANDTMYRLVARTLTMPPAPLVRLVSLTNCMFDGWQKHIIDTEQHDRDIRNLWEKYPAHFKLTSVHRNRGRHTMRDWGIPAGAKWVCLIVRDAAYLPGLAYHSYRDSDIETYTDAAMLLADRGYYVFRMGAVVAKPWSARHPRIIDYATDGKRSDFMDVYLGAECAFCVTNGCGFDAIPAVFRRPLCFVNYAPLEYLPTWFQGSLAIWKHYEREGKRMTLEEIAKSEAGHFMRADEFEAAGITLVNNTQQEIRDVVDEMEDFVTCPYKSYRSITIPSDESDRQSAFWSRFPRSLSKYNQKPLHGEIRMRIGSKFLREYV